MKKKDRSESGEHGNRIKDCEKKSSVVIHLAARNIRDTACVENRAFGFRDTAALAHSAPAVFSRRHLKQIKCIAVEEGLFYWLAVL